VRPGGVEGHHTVANRSVLHAGAELAHRPGAQVANDMRGFGLLPARAGKQVASLDADRLGVNDHAAFWALWLGHVLVAKDVRFAGRIDHRRLHRLPLSLACH
jgi:hypothetical protein